MEALTMHGDRRPEGVERLSQEPLEERIAIASKRIEILNLEIAAEDREIEAEFAARRRGVEEQREVVQQWGAYLESIRNLQKVEDRLLVTPNGHARVAR